MTGSKHKRNVRQDSTNFTHVHNAVSRNNSDRLKEYMRRNVISSLDLIPQNHIHVDEISQILERQDSLLMKQNQHSRHTLIPEINILTLPSYNAFKHRKSILVSGICIKLLMFT